MTWIRLSQSELRRVPAYRYSYNAYGYILLSYGRVGNHVRLDLVRYENRRFYRQDPGGDWHFRVYDFHVKIRAGENSFLYAFYAYRGGGVWQWRHDLFKQGGRHRGRLRDGEFARCQEEARHFLRQLRGVTTDMDQTLAVDAAPEQLRHLPDFA